MDGAPRSQFLWAGSIGPGYGWRKPRIEEFCAVHLPIPGNQAQTELFLPKDEDLTEARYHLTEIAEFVIPFA
jgi:hypothetical protein